MTNSDETIVEDVYLRTCSLDTAFLTPMDLDCPFQQFLAKALFDPDVQYLDRDDTRKFLDHARISRLFRSDNNSCAILYLGRGIERWQMLFHFRPDCVFLEPYSSERISLALRGPRNSSLRFTDCLIQMCEAFKCYWGEIQVDSLQEATVSRDHYEQIPALSSENYFRYDYVVGIGGEQRFYDAGFIEIQRFRDGIVTKLANLEHESINREEFEIRRHTVQERISTRLFTEGNGIAQTCIKKQW